MSARPSAACVVARFGDCRAVGNGCQTMMGRLAAFSHQASLLWAAINSNKIPAIMGFPMRTIAVRHWLADPAFALSLTLSEC